MHRVLQRVVVINPETGRFGGIPTPLVAHGLKMPLLGTMPHQMHLVTYLLPGVVDRMTRVAEPEIQRAEVVARIGQACFVIWEDGDVARLAEAGLHFAAGVAAAAGLVGALAVVHGAVGIDEETFGMDWARALLFECSALLFFVRNVNAGVVELVDQAIPSSGASGGTAQSQSSSMISLAFSNDTHHPSLAFSNPATHCSLVKVLRAWHASRCGPFITFPLNCRQNFGVR